MDEMHHTTIYVEYGRERQRSITHRWHDQGEGKREDRHGIDEAYPTISLGNV
jgi:hypothetical protein